MKHRAADVIGELDVLENDLANDRADVEGAFGIFVFRPLRENLASPFQTRERFADLRTDVDDPDDWRDQEREKGRRKSSNWPAVSFPA